MTRFAIVLLAVLVAAPARASERQTALDALIAEQRSYGGWVFAAPPGERARPFTEIMQLAERLASPFGLAK